MALADVDEFVKAALVRRLADVGLKQEVLAKLMGISPSQLSAQLQPGGHLSITRVLLAADDDDGLRFLQLFWNDIAEHLGLENTDAIAAELKRFQGRLAWVVDKIQARLGREEHRDTMRMAKAGLRDAVKKRTA